MVHIRSVSKLCLYQHKYPTKIQRKRVITMIIFNGLDALKTTNTISDTSEEFTSIPNRLIR